MNIQEVKKHFISWPKLIKEKAISIYIYGSVARNDNDAESDCDILVCIDDCSNEEYHQLKAAVQELQEVYKYEFSFYQLSVLQAMCQKGSYFLWHIKTEGVLLYQRDSSIEALLNNLCTYTGTLNDLLEYSEILNDIKISIEEDELTFEYDLSVLATLARNICIASCFLIGQMDFGRTTPITKCIHYWKSDFPFSLDEYTNLYKYRIFNTRRISPQIYPPTKEYILHWHKKISILLSLALSLCQI